MKFNPHGYQKYAIEYIETHKIAAILLDMGLGKTAITLTAIDNLLFDRFDIKKVLVIAPLRVAKNTWPQEVKKWEHLDEIRISVATGTEKERKAALANPADVYVINRENVKWLVEDSGAAFDYDMVVVDELSSFKNWRASRFRALLKVRPKVKRIVGLTGTPSSNGLMDLFAEFKVLDLGARLGRTITWYRSRYFAPASQNGQIVYSYAPRPGAEREIYDKISDITISMKAADHLKMPQLLESVYTVELDKDERAKYEAMKEKLVLSLGQDEITAANAGVLTGKLLQMANGAVYADDGKAIKIHERKLDALEDIIEAMNEKPLLVAYWFKHDLERITKRLASKKIPFEKLDTPASIERWNERKIPVALIHPASAGHGLNLQDGGNTIVWFGLTWSLELYQQTVARLNRQGQKENTVVVQHIIAADTIDGHVLKALQRKEKTQSALIDAVKANLRGDNDA